MPGSADLSNNFKSIILIKEKRPKKNVPIIRLILEEQQKYLFSNYLSSQNNATFHPMNSDDDVTYQTVNLFSSDKCFIYFIFDVPHYI